MTLGTATAPTDAPASDHRDGNAQSIEIIDPRDGSFVGRFERADAGQAAASVSKAREAFRSWAKVSAEERGRMLRQAAANLAEHDREIAELNARETGRPLEEALAGVAAGVGTLQQYAELGPVHRGHSLRGQQGAVDYSVHEPRGVVVALTPWNDPVAVACGLLGAAIVTGNTVVHKPSERCPHAGLRLGEVLAEAFPANVLQTLTGDGSTGHELVTLAGVDVIAHIGSTATGQSIARAAAATGAHVVRENGGNDALIVDKGVDPAWAAEQAAIGAFSNSGQICTSVERIFVHHELADEFIDALIAEAEKRNSSKTLGPLVDDRLREAVHAQVAQSVAAGAVVRAGGEVPPGGGCFYPATVLTGCLPSMPIMSEETFGPIAPVQVIDSFAEGLELAVDDRYGLAATVLTPSMENAHRAATELPVGTVKVNAVFGGAPGGSAQPRGASGSGFGYGPELLDELTTVKVVHLGLAKTAEERQ